MRLAFVLLVCAIVAPKTLWGAHLAGHAELSSESAVHTHHGDHVHELAGDKALPDDHGADGAGPGQGLAHDHGPCVSLTSAWLLPEDPELPASFVSTDLRFERSFAAKVVSRPDSFLRPPRAG
jgi:hypothetical protein